MDNAIFLLLCKGQDFSPFIQITFKFIQQSFSYIKIYILNLLILFLFFLDSLFTYMYNSDIFPILFVPWA